MSHTRGHVFFEETRMLERPYKLGDDPRPLFQGLFGPHGAPMPSNRLLALLLTSSASYDTVNDYTATFLKQEFQRSLLSKLAAALAWPVLSRFKQRVDHRRYNGASLLGLRGIVIKSHGSADPFAYQFALNRAIEECRRGVLRRIAEQIAIEHPPVAPVAA